MKRRQFLAVPTLAITVGIALNGAAQADTTTHLLYTPEAYQQALADGEPFMLDFYAPW